MKKISNPTTKYANLSKEELLVLLSERDTKLDSLEKQVTELEWYKQQVMALNKARMGTSSEKIAEDQLNLFNEFEGLDPKVRQEQRQMQCLPIVDELFTTISRIKGDYPTKSKMGVAITYAINDERYLRNYLLDGRLELTNNRAERAIKPFVIGHKNFLFSNTKNGAQMSSIYYSLVESAKLNNFDIQAYFEYILDELTYTPESWWQETIQRLLPYSKELPEHVYAKLK